MRALRAGLLGALLSAPNLAVPLTVAWDASPSWPSGTTVEVCANSVCAEGVTTTSAVLDAPLLPGDRLRVQARAIPPLGYQCGSPLILCPPSEYATLAAIYPSPLIQYWATKSLIEVPTMAAPTFVAQYATEFNTTTSPKTAMSAVAITSGDVLVAVGVKENDLYYMAVAENGGASFIAKQSIDLSYYTEVAAYTYIAPSSETITVTFTSNASYRFGGNVIRFSGASGIGASSKANAYSGSPSVSITTTQANSAIVVIVGDWNARSGTQTFTSNGGAGNPTLLTGYPGDNTYYGVAIAYYPDAGTAGAKTVGMSAPTGQQWAIIAVEVKGTAGATGSLPPRLSNRFAHLLGR